MGPVSCGTGRHIRALASRGVACRGVDMNKAMLEFTRREVERDGLMIELEDGDMRTYSLPVSSPVLGVGLGAPPFCNSPSMHLG